MRVMRLVGMVSLCVLLVSVQSRAEPVQYTADKWHTRIYFTVDHMGLSNYSGRFIEHEIHFLFDEDNFEMSKIEVTVPVDSIDTFSPELNSKMGDSGFFDSGNFPHMHFISTGIEKIDESHARMTGDLTIKATTLPITFDVSYN